MANWSLWDIASSSHARVTEWFKVIQERKSEVNSPERNRIVTPWHCLLYLILCDLMDFSLPGSSVLGISQARLLEWVAISFSWGSFQSRDQTQVSCLAGGFFSNWATMEALKILLIDYILCTCTCMYVCVCVYPYLIFYLITEYCKCNIFQNYTVIWIYSSFLLENFYNLEDKHS